jgi:hypothetical protein
MNMQDVEPIEIKVRNRTSMDPCITAAVDRMIESARRQRTHGILVTRVGDGSETGTSSSGSAMQSPLATQNKSISDAKPLNGLWTLPRASGRSASNNI